MPMASNGLHRKRDHKGRKPMLWEAELTIAVTFLFTALLTIYAVTVRALCLEYRKSGLAD